LPQSLNKRHWVNANESIQYVNANKTRAKVTRAKIKIMALQGLFFDRNGTADEKDDQP
jgi:hypothetical protein